MTLKITITSVTDTDIDNNAITVKSVSATIGGKEVGIVSTFDNSLDDASCRTAFKNYLTSLGYTWTTEE